MRLSLQTVVVRCSLLLQHHMRLLLEHLLLMLLWTHAAPVSAPVPLLMLLAALHAAATGAPSVTSAWTVCAGAPLRCVDVAAP